MSERQATAVSRSGAWNACAGVVVLVVVLGVCLTTLAEAASSTHPVCMAVTGEELSAFKAPSSHLWAVPVYHAFACQELSPSEYLPPELVPARASAVLWAELSPRAPPVRL